MITNSMIFSLIPLHDNEKCIEYYSIPFGPKINYVFQIQVNS